MRLTTISAVNSNNSQSNSPRLVVVMGVSGTGKSTLAKQLSHELSFEYLDGDDFHSEEAKSLMASNQQICAAMRQQWVDHICGQLSQRFNGNQSVVLAFSGLIAAHRLQMKQLPFQTFFIHLMGSRALIEKRMSARKNHFVTHEFLEGQLAALEPFGENEQGVIKLNIQEPIATLVATALKQLGN